MSILVIGKKVGKIMSEKINQSTLNNILFKITSFDENASSIYEIDSQKEVDRLGSYLNGQIDGFTCEDYGLPAHNELSESKNKDIYDYLKNLYDSVKDKFTTPKGEKTISEIEAFGAKVSSFNEKIKNKEYTQIVAAIIKDNVSDIDPMQLAALSSDYYLTEKGLKAKTIKYGQEHIEKQLLAKAKELGVSQDAIDEAKSKKEKGFDVYVNYLTKAIQNKENEIAEKNEKFNPTVPSTENDKDSPQAKLQAACNEYVKENGITVNLDRYGRKSFGDYRYGYNGEVEVGGATQRTGNCWLMAGFNAVAAVAANEPDITDKSEETANFVDKNDAGFISENIYRDQKHGVTAVYLPEAAQRGAGYNGKGIYFVPDKYINIKNCDGDLDIVAYNSAVEQYFEETKQDTYINRHLRSEGFDVNRLDGNSLSRVFEIISGKETVTKDYLCADSNNIVRTKNVQYVDVVETLKQGAAITLAIRVQETAQALNGSQLNCSKDALHAFSVVGVDESGNIVLQESNNSEKVAKLFKNSYKGDDGVWHIVVTPEEFEKISFLEASALKVK